MDEVCRRKEYFKEVTENDGERDVSIGTGGLEVRREEEIWENGEQMR